MIIFLCTLFVFFSVTVKKINKDDLEVCESVCVIINHQGAVFALTLTPELSEALRIWKSCYFVILTMWCSLRTYFKHTKLSNSTPRPPSSVWSQSSSLSCNAYLVQCSPSLNHHQARSHHSHRQDNAPPNWWKETLPRLELNEVVVVVRTAGRGAESLKWEAMLVTWCSLAGAVTHLKSTETALVSLVIHPSADTSARSKESWLKATLLLSFWTDNRLWI